ncbi:MAG: class I SAM-dependent methyltransferase, partial [Lachnospiraceae bacterium]|nr:class I SAM-dependent methyltransferase [Lachnospiraceae bacterium]
CSFIWENTWNEEEQINEYDLTVFVEEEDGRYRRFDETHLQRGYTETQMKKAIVDGGMVWISGRDAEADGPVTDETERGWVIAKEQGK